MSRPRNLENSRWRIAWSYDLLMSAFAPAIMVLTGTGRGNGTGVGAHGTKVPYK